MFSKIVLKVFLMFYRMILLFENLKRFKTVLENSFFFFCEVFSVISVFS